MIGFTLDETNSTWQEYGDITQKWYQVGEYFIYKFDEHVTTKGLKWKFKNEKGGIAVREIRFFQGTESKPYRFKSLEKLDEDRSVFVYLMQ